MTWKLAENCSTKWFARRYQIGSETIVQSRQMKTNLLFLVIFWNDHYWFYLKNYSIIQRLCMQLKVINKYQERTPHWNRLFCSNELTRLHVFSQIFSRRTCVSIRSHQVSVHTAQCNSILANINSMPSDVVFFKF